MIDPTVGQLTEEETKHLDDLLYKACHDENFDYDENVTAYKLELFRKYGFDPSNHGIDSYTGKIIQLRNW